MMFLKIETFCKPLGLVIAGYYQANEHLSDSRFVQI